MIVLDTLEISWAFVLGHLRWPWFRYRLFREESSWRPTRQAPAGVFGKVLPIWGEIHQGTNDMAKANISKMSDPDIMLWSCRESQVRPISRGSFGASSFTSRSGLYGKFRHPWPAKNFSLVFLARGCQSCQSWVYWGMAHLACENFQAARDTFEEALDELEDHRGRTAGLMLFYQDTQWSQMVSACSCPVRIGLDSSEVITCTVIT